MAAQAAGLHARAGAPARQHPHRHPDHQRPKRLREIWLSRELLVYLVRTEIKVKYKNSVLGLVWSMVAPAMSLLIYLFVFSIVLSNGMPNFVIFLFAGLLLWNLFQLGVLTGTGMVVNNAGIVKKVSFPGRSWPWPPSARPACSSSSSPSSWSSSWWSSTRGRAGPTCRCSCWHCCRRRVGVRHRGAPLGGERLSPRHPASGGGHPDRLVLGLSHRLLLPAADRDQESGREA